MCRHGWLLLYHGVHELAQRDPKLHRLNYSAGAMMLSSKHPAKIIYRSPQPVLTPTEPMEMQGTVDDVVFPTGIDRRDDLGTPDRFDVYFGMADIRSALRVSMFQKRCRRRSARVAIFKHE